MEIVILIVHVLAAIGVIALVLLQQGKGADMGAAFGSGASSTVFGSEGSSSFITRSTGVLATLFFVTSLTLAVFSSRGVDNTSVTESAVTDIVESTVSGAEDMPSAPQSTVADAPAKASSSDMPVAPAVESDTPQPN